MKNIICCILLLFSNIVFARDYPPMGGIVKSTDIDLTLYKHNLRVDDELLRHIAACDLALSQFPTFTASNAKVKSNKNQLGETYFSVDFVIDEPNKEITGGHCISSNIFPWKVWMVTIILQDMK